MTPSAMLAAAARPLVEVLIDRVRWACRTKAQAAIEQMTSKTDPQWSLDLGEEDHIEPPPSAPKPSDFAAAVVVGRAFDDDRTALSRLQEPASITIIRLSSADQVGPVRALLRAHILGSITTRVIEESRLLLQAFAPAPGTCIVFGETEDGGRRREGRDENVSSLAVQSGCAIIGISAEAEKHIPSRLVKIATTVVDVPPLDSKDIAIVVEAITGQRPTGLDDTSVKGLSFADLDVAVHSDLSAAECSERLRRLVTSSQNADDDAPLLAEMVGIGPVKEWGLQLAADLQAYSKGALPWSAVSPGALLVSAPGRGKTTVARALARQCGVDFIPTSYSQWQSAREGHLGHVTAAIRKTFSEAYLQRPCIVFIDEIDSLPRRDGSRKDNEWWRAIVNCLLEMLDGFEKREGVVVIAATNASAAELDPALVRAGRLDRTFVIPEATVEDLVGIFRWHLKTDLGDCDLRPVALAARGRSGADVERIVRDGRAKARRTGEPLTTSMLMNVLRDGARPLPAPLRKLVGYHESGHALAAISLGLAKPVALSIDVDGGLTESEPAEIRALTRNHLEHYLVMLLAGRAAEEIEFGEVSAGSGVGGAGSDLARANWLAAQMETTYGLGQSLCWTPGERAEQVMLVGSLRRAVEETLDRCYREALRILRENRRCLDAVAAELFRAGYLGADEIEAIVARVGISRSKPELTSAPLDDRNVIPETTTETAPALAGDGA